ncbi:MAG: winged helix-turn-helix domain-containing protein [Holosporales bacterium]|jgi:transposase|nr:winged helix-turn-helix domain-containing protein [Holosporales bacterium]
MKSLLLSPELAEAAKLELKKLRNNVLVARKLEAIIAACSFGITEVAKVFNIRHMTLRSWIKRFLESGIERLKAPLSRRRKSILNDSDREIVREIIDKDSQVTIDVMVQKVLEICGKKISRSSMHREMQELKYSYITPRPQHYKQDKEKVETFKKTSMRS